MSLLSQGAFFGIGLSVRVVRYITAVLATEPELDMPGSAGRGELCRTLPYVINVTFDRKSYAACWAQFYKVYL